jgi:hypothetical protein
MQLWIVHPLLNLEVHSGTGDTWQLLMLDVEFARTGDVLVETFSENRR